MATGWSTEETKTLLGVWGAADGSCLSASHGVECDTPPHLGLIGTTGRDLCRLCVQVRTQSKSIESSFSCIAVNLESM